MTMQADGPVFETICGLIKAQMQVSIPLTRSVQIGADLEADSVKVFDLIMEIEDTYNINLPMEAISEVTTIGDLADLVERLQNA